jgi:hypothetical protein
MFRSQTISVQKKLKNYLETPSAVDNGEGEKKGRKSNKQVKSISNCWALPTAFRVKRHRQQDSNG